MQQPMLNLGQPTWEYEHFDARYQYTPSQDAQVRSLLRSINTKNVANSLIGVSWTALVKERRNSRRVVAQDLLCSVRWSGAGLYMNDFSSVRLLGGEILADGRAGPTSKSYKNHQRSGPGEDDVGDRTSSEQLPFFG